MSFLFRVLLFAIPVLVSTSADGQSSSIPYLAPILYASPAIANQRPAPLHLWAEHGAAVKIPVEIPPNQTLDLKADAYWVSGKLVAACGKDLPLGNQLTSKDGNPVIVEFPLPDPVKLGRLLLKIGGRPADKAGEPLKFLADVFVDILPKDAWAALKQAGEMGQLQVDPKLIAFKAWFDKANIQSVEPTREPELGKPCFCFLSSDAAMPTHLTENQFVISEAKEADALPVVEKTMLAKGKNILLPPGFLEHLPGSPTAQALLLKLLELR